MIASRSSAASVPATEHVILLHGLCRTSRSMEPIAKALRAAGYVVHNIDYPSRTAPIEGLAGPAIAPAVAACEMAGATRIHFVTHSLGGILVRQYLASHRIPQLGRVVMLGPPNQGSEVVDRLGGWWLFRRLNGAAGAQLGTTADSLPNRLGAVNYPVGVIAGDRSINWINSFLIPGRDDGKVSVDRTRVAGMGDHLVVPCSHPFLMRDRFAIRQTLEFLRNGRFTRPAKRSSSGRQTALISSWRRRRQASRNGTITRNLGGSQHARFREMV
ncbi:MAG TPA: alpha/beta fold hydrolase [Lacunisphaera sp.]|nr:alpha/beta fold hydrolase [Lacunisphaera sp.]